MIRAGERLGGHWPNLPSNWRVVRADALFVYRKDIVTVSELDGVEVVHYSIPALGAGGEPVVEDGATIASSKFRVRGDEVLVSKLNPRKGHVFLTEAHDRLAVCSTEFVPLVPRAEVDRRFAYYLYHSTPVRERISATVQSATRSHQRANPDQIYKVWVPAPPISEQTSIADFLDEKTAAIDALIAKKERLIELIEEKRQATITHAVTKGLDPDVPMKDSGVEWLGEVPAHWEIVPLRYEIDVLGGGTPSKQRDDYWGGHIPWVSPKDMKKTVINGAEDSITVQALQAINIPIVQPPAVLMVVRGMILAHTVPVALTSTPLTVNQDMKALVPSSRLLAEFLALYFQAANPALLSYVEEAGHGTKRLPSELWHKLPLALPPRREQNCISVYVSETSQRFQRAVENLKDQISRLREYRQTLISAAVTGQLDVRSRTARALDPTALEPLEEVLT